MKRDLSLSSRDAVGIGQRPPGQVGGDIQHGPNLALVSRRLSPLGLDSLLPIPDSYRVRDGV